MLIPYTYVPHKIEKMQRFINFIFYQVWCRAPKAGSYSLELFDANLSLKKVMVSFAYDHTKEGDLFSSRIQEIYEAFSMLHRADIVQFKRWYQSNNDIECACSNAHRREIVHYAEIQAKHPKLGRILKLFFTNLYSSNLLGLKVLRDQIGKVDDHYRAFMTVNNTGKCPFCGIADMLGEYHNKRDAYDHYLPKAIYPFNSINFHNLAPACHHCNSNYKTSKDPAFVPKDPTGGVVRRKAFYPYRLDGDSIEVAIELESTDVDKLTPADIQLMFGPSGIQDEIETWREVYGIDERYKSKFCSSDAKDWLEQVRILRDEHNVEPTASLATIQKQFKKAPLANSNFLKIAFLDGCHRAGILENI